PMAASRSSRSRPAQRRASRQQRSTAPSCRARYHSPLEAAFAPAGDQIALDGDEEDARKNRHHDAGPRQRLHLLERVARDPGAHADSTPARCILFSALARDWSKGRLTMKKVMRTL